MFESVAASLLNRILGGYVANLSQDQLSLGIMAGNAQLTNLKLKPDALQLLNLPVDVVDGHLGQLTMQIPWSALKTKPVILEIKDLFVLAGPKSKFIYDPERELEAALKKKLSKLETFEIVQASADSISVQDPEKSESFFSHLTNRILNNLQIRIENIHIRYEEENIAFGIVIESLRVISTNSQWEESFGSEGPVHKLAHLEKFSVYFDCNQSKKESKEDEEVSLAEKFDKQKLEEHDYIIHPISTNCKLILQQYYSEDAPKIKMEFDISSINVSLSDTQYLSVVSLAEKFLLLKNSLRYLPIRQKYPGDALSAKYTYECIQSDIQETLKNRNWNYIVARRKNRNLYVSSFVAKLNGRASAVDNKNIELMEKALDLVDLRFFRNLARQAKKVQPASVVQSYWSWVTGGGMTSAEGINEDDRRSLYQAIDFSESTTSLNITVPRNFITINIESRLSGLSLALIKGGHKALDVQFSDFFLSLVKRPRNISVDFEIGDLKAVEGLLESSLYQNIAKRRSMGTGEGKKLLKVSFSDYVTSPVFDSKLVVFSEPLEIVYNHQAFSLISSFFEIGKESVLNQLILKEAERSIQELASQTRGALENVVKSHKAVELDIHLQAPLILLPISSVDREEACFLVDLGHIDCHSNFIETEKRKSITLDTGGVLKFNPSYYDLLQVHLSKAKLMFAYGFSDSISGFDEILDDIDIDLKIYDSFLPKYYDIIPTMVFGKIPPLTFKFSDYKYKQFMRLVDIFKPPQFVPQMEGTSLNEDEFFDTLEGNLDVKSMEKVKVKIDLDFENITLIVFEDSVAAGATFPNINSKAELLQIDAVNLAVGVEICQKVIDVDVVLKSFNWKDKDGLTVIKGIGIEKDESLLNVHVKLIDLDHPLFVSRYESVKYHVSFDLSSVTLAIRPSTFIHEMQYTLWAFVEDDPRRLAAQPFPPQPTNKRIKGNLKQFNICLRDDKDLRGEAFVVNASTLIDFTPKYNNVNFKIEEIELWNRKPIPSEAFSCPFVKLEENCCFEISYNFSDFPIYGDEMCTSEMILKSGSPYFTYMPQFTEEFLIFINLMKTIKPPPPNRPPELSRMCYRIELDSPILLLPIDLDVSSAIALFFGNVNVFNRFNNREMTDQFIEGDITDIRAEYKVGDNTICEILKKTSASLNVTQVYKANSRDLPNNQIQVKTECLEFILNRDLYTIFLDQMIFLIGTVNQASSPIIGPPLPFYDPESNKPIYTTRLLWEIPKITLSLLEENDENFAQLKLLHNQFCMETWSNMVLKMKFPCLDFTVKDFSVSESQYTEIISGSHKPGPNEDVFFLTGVAPFGISYERNEHLEADLKMIFNSLRVVFFVDLIFRLKAYIVDSWPKPRPPREGVPPPLQGPPQRFCIELVKLVLLLVEDYRRADSECCKLTLESLLYNFRINWNLNIKAFQAFLCDINDLTGTELEILDAVDALWIGEVENPLDQNIALDITPIIFNLSFEDLLFMFSIFRQASERFSQSKYLGQPGQLSLTDFKKRFGFNLNLIRIALIDDISKANIPFADISLDSISYESTNVNNEVNGTGKFLLQANFFNLENSHWEPLIEPAELEIITKPGEISTTTDSQINFTSGLNFNIATKFISAVYELATRITSSPSKEKHLTAIRETSMPYLITNQIGYKLNVWNDNAEINDVKIVTIENGMSLPWTFKNWKDSRKSHKSTFNTLALHILDSEWETLRKLPVDREIFYTVPLRPEINKISIRLVIEIRVKERLKEIVIRSPYSLANMTQFPVEVSVVGVDKNPSINFTIQPGKRTSLPLENLHSGLFRIRPSDQGYEFCENMIPIKEFFTFEDEEEELYLQEKCKNSDPNIAPFFFTLTNLTEKDHVELIAKSPGTIYIEAPLEVVNLLPMDIRFRAYDLRSKFDFGGSIKKGASAPFHAIDTSHPLGFSLEVDGTDWKSSQVANINSPSGGKDEIDGIISMKNSAGSELSLCTKVVCSTRCQRSIMIYSPYVILNSSLVDLEIVPSASAMSRHFDETEIFWCLHNSNGPSDPIIFSFPDADALRNKIMIRAAGASEWSAPITLSKIGVSNEINLQNKTTLSWFNLSLVTSIGLSRYSCVTLVKVRPLFMVKNDTHLTIYFKAGNESLASEIAPNSQLPMHFNKSQFDKVRISIEPSEYWSASFGINKAGRDILKCPTSDKDLLIRVTREISKGTWFIFITEEKSWPMTLQNDSPYKLTFGQKGISKKYFVEPGEKYHFAWDEPFKGEKLISLEVEGKMRIINPNEIGQLLPLTVRDPKSGQRKNLSLSVLAQGPKIILMVALFDSKTSYYKSRDSLASAKDSVTDEAAFEEKSIACALSAVFTLKVPFIGFSFIQENCEELVYLSARGVEFRYTQSDIHTTMGLSIGWLQLDNQSVDWQIPILFYPTDVQRQVESNEVLPFIKLALIKLNSEEYGLNCYRYFGFLMQECSLEVSEDILAKLLTFVPKVVMGGRVPLFTDEDVMPPKVNTSILDTPSYFEVFQLHPIKVNFSFSKTESTEKKKGFAVYNPLTAAMEIILMTIGQVSDANLRYNALVLENVVINRRTLLKLVIQNYRNETLGQLHRLIGSADIFGNPAGLFQNFSSGVTDLFYEPYQGFVSDRPQDFGLGLAKGTASLIRHTIYGISDSFAKLTGTFGRGFAAATLDKSYQRKRRIDRARNKPKHALEGLASGTLQFITGVTSGVAGLVEKPVELARREGATGFFKGVGLGLVGVVTKPLVGVMDMTTTFTEGIRGSADGGEVELLPARLPRAVPFDGVLLPYDQYEAEGQGIYISAIGKHRREKYVAHLARLGGDDVGSCLLLTTRKIYLVRLGSKRIVWGIYLSSLQKVSKQGQNVLMIDDGEGHRIMLLAEERLDWFLERYNILTMSNKRMTRPKMKK